MSDRPTGANGKRSQAWGTTTACPACGQCLCFGCHPRGPCVDENQAELSSPFAAAGGNAAFDRASRAWTCGPAEPTGVAGLQLRSGRLAERIR